MALSFLTFLAAWLTLRRRPWTPRLIAWIAVGISATTAGILLGIAADKMLYESYGLGGWLQMGRAACGRRSLRRCSCATCADGGAAAADVPRTARPARVPAPARCCRVLLWHCADRHHADRSRNRARLHLRSALPRFSLRLADHGGGAVRAPDAAEPPAGGRASDRRSGVRRPVRWLARSISASTRAADNWQSLWTCAMYLLLALTLWRARAAQSPK